jgi:hypothetical protein
VKAASASGHSAREANGDASGTRYLRPAQPFLGSVFVGKQSQSTGGFDAGLAPNGLRKVGSHVPAKVIDYFPMRSAVADPLQPVEQCLS